MAISLAAARASFPEFANIGKAIPDLTNQKLLSKVTYASSAKTGFALPASSLDNKSWHGGT
jgi:hypothetical protein